MNRLELEKKRDELAPMENGRAPWLNGWAQCANLLMPEIERSKGEMDLHLAQCMSQQKEIGQLNANRETSERTINELMAQREQLRAQLSRAKETIADFRATLEKIGELDSDPQNHHKDASKCAICHAKEAREALAASAKGPQSHKTWCDDKRCDGNCRDE